MTHSTLKWHPVRTDHAAVPERTVGYGLAMLVSAAVWIALGVWLVS